MTLRFCIPSNSFIARFLEVKFRLTDGIPHKTRAAANRQLLYISEVTVASQEMCSIPDFSFN
jgi:hypothetical protein